MNISRTIDRTRIAEAEPVRLLIIGKPKGIQATIDHLCVLGFSDHADWSKIMPRPDSTEFMSIMTKWRVDE